MMIMLIEKSFIFLPICCFSFRKIFIRKDKLVDDSDNLDGNEAVLMCLMDSIVWKSWMFFCENMKNVFPLGPSFLPAQSEFCTKAI